MANTLKVTLVKSPIGAVPKHKKTPVRPHFDKSQKGNMFSNCGAMYVT